MSLEADKARRCDLRSQAPSEPAVVRATQFLVVVQTEVRVTPRPPPKVSREAAEQFSARGFLVIPQLLVPEESHWFGSDLDSALAGRSSHEGARRHRGQLFAARNLGRLWPGLRELVALVETRLDMHELAGQSMLRLSRALFFDKPIPSGWSLPWHRDTNVAIDSASTHARTFNRAGVPHIQAGEDVLAQMVSVRVHLDPQGEDNGALEVLAGTHRTQEDQGAVPQVVEADAGSVLVFRPLLLHRSGSSSSASSRRRVVHLEYAGTDNPGQGCAWRTVW